MGEKLEKYDVICLVASRIIRFLIDLEFEIVTKKKYSGLEASEIVHLATGMAYAVYVGRLVQDKIGMSKSSTEQLCDELRERITNMTSDIVAKYCDDESDSEGEFRG